MIQYIKVETDEKGKIVGLGFVDKPTDAYVSVKQKLAAESGLADFCSVEEHLAAIKSKANLGGLNKGHKYIKDILAKYSGLDPTNVVADHIAAIKLKVYDEGYDKGWHDKQADIQKRIKQFEDAIKETIENE